MAIRKWRGWSTLAIGAILMFFWAASAWGQEITAGIRGTVTDPTGAVVSGATVTAKNVATAYTRDMVTDSTGGYVFSALPVGPYEVSVSMPGFKEYVRSGIILAVNQVAGVNVTLELGAVTQKVEVKGQAVIVNTQTSETGMLLEGQMIRDLPLNGRNPIQLATLTSGVRAIYLTQYLAQWGGTITDTIDGGGSVITVNGNRPHQTQFNLDGGEFAGTAYDTGLNYPNPDALQEFRFMTQNYGADFGRLPGGVMNVITKSGTNRFHGSLWEFNRNSALATKGWGNPKEPFLNQNQFGFTGGGPIVKDKLFFFGSVQWLRIAQGLVASGQLVPTAAERGGDLSKDYYTGQPYPACPSTPPYPAACHAVIDPLTGLQFPGNQVPASRFDPLAMQLLNLFPLPNMPNGTFYTQESSPVLNHQYLLKTDYQMSTANRLTVSLFRDNTDARQLFGRGGIGNGLPYVNSTGPAYGTNGGIISNLIVSDTHVFGPNLLNQFRFGYTRVRAVNGQSEETHPTMKDLNPHWVQVSPMAQPGLMIVGRGFSARGQWGLSDSDDYQFQDKITYIRGGHNVKIGAEVRKVSHQLIGTLTTNGIYVSGAFSTPTRDAMSDWLLGIAGGFMNSAATSMTAFQNSFAGYLQDDYRVNRRLVVNFGVRYQIAPAWTPAYKYKLSDGSFSTGVATWNPGQQSTIMLNAPKGVVYAKDPGIPASGSFTDMTNIDPRAGFGWDVFGTGKTALRGGIGVYHEMPGQRFTNPVTVPFGAAQLGWTVTPMYDSAAPAETTGFASFPPKGTFPLPPLSRDASFSRYLPFQSELMIGLHRRNALVAQYNLTLEQELGRGVVLGVSYVGNRGSRLPWGRDINPGLYIPGNDANGDPLSTSSNILQRRVLNQGTPEGSPYLYGRMGVWEDSARSYYDSLQVQVNTRDFHGLTIQGNYTWGHAIDYQSAYFINLISNSTQNPNCIECDKGNSTYDIRHNLVLSYSYRTPSLTKALRFNNRVASAIVDNWGLSGMNNFSTGGYGTINSTYGDNSLTGVAKDRADVVPGVDWRLPSGRSQAEKIAQYFNPAAFQDNAIGSYGNVGRGVIQFPGSWSMDLAAMKRFPFGAERQREVEFRCEFYNALGHTNLGSPNTQLGPGFGTIFQVTGSRRIIQLGLKLMF